MQVVEGCEIGPRSGGATLRTLGTLVPLSRSLSVKPAVCRLCVSGPVSQGGMCAHVWVSGWTASKLEALCSRGG